MKKVIAVIVLVLMGLGVNAQTWTPNKKYVKAEKAKKEKGVQCYGTTKKGERCKMKGQAGIDGKFWCRFHEGQK